MKTHIKVVLALICAVVLVAFSGCSSASKGLEALTTNTTLEEAEKDIAIINSAIMEAKRMVQQKDTSVYGDLVHADSVSFKDVVVAKGIDEQTGTKRIDGTAYYLYWDTSKHYPFWSTDGSDDIRNTKENMIPVVHSNSIRIKNKTNVTALT